MGFPNHQTNCSCFDISYAISSFQMFYRVLTDIVVLHQQTQAMEKSIFVQTQSVELKNAGDVFIHTYLQRYFTASD